MNCWIIWWTGNSKFKISSLIWQIKIKKSYLLSRVFVLFLMLCYAIINYYISWTAVKFTFRMLGCCLDLLKFPCIPPPPPWGIPRTFKLLKIGLFKHPPLPGTKIVFKAQTTVKNSWVAGGDVEAYWHIISRQRVSTWWILVYFEMYVF